MLKAGYSRVDITPEISCRLIGYPLRQEMSAGHRGIHDRLHARALCVRGLAADDVVLLLSLDLCVLETPLCNELRDAVAQQVNLPRERVVLACTHTHSGPFPRSGATSSEAQTATLSEGILAGTAGAETYTGFLRRQVLDAAQEACGLLYPVSLWVREAEVELAYNRRCQGDGGLQHCWNPQESPERLPTGPTDRTCVVVELRQTHGSRRYTLWNYGMHPVCLGSTSRVVSGDWPGLATCQLEAAHNRQAMFFLGAAGDVHPWIATQENPENAQRMARAAAAFVDVLGDALVPVGCDGRLPFRSVCETIDGTLVDLSACSLGGCLILCAPVELFAGLGRRIRSAFSCPVLLLTNTNGWTGYWPTAAAFEQGGYEVAPARRAGRTARSGDTLCDRLIALGQECLQPQR